MQKSLGNIVTTALSPYQWTSLDGILIYSGITANNNTSNEVMRLSTDIITV